MRILYTPVGDTDPIRGCYDGGMLHIALVTKTKVHRTKLN
ncbi:hypothetical protein Vpar_1800 [Veillonella parvula DSM 2008]|nr:hypothetical protein Vpar_1800 [Veillonella parvula DSM 2008]SNV02691.1 Uncharacterised protein [Veillonella parvula]